MNMHHMGRTILVGVMMFLAAACSGGGESSGGPDGASPPVVNLASTTVTADSSVPGPVVNAITEVISPVASGPLSSSIQIATTNSRDSFVLALDAADKIRLAAMTSDGSTILNADSTALALVRMVIGVLPSDITASQTNQAIRGAAEFPALVGLIRGVLNTDLAPHESGAVVQSIVTTTREAMSTISVILAPPQSGGAPSVMAFASRPVTTPLPFKILGDFTSVFSVYVNSAGNGGSVNLVNATPIVWSAHSLDESDILIPAPAPSPDGKVLLEANTVVRSLFDKVSPWLGPSSINLPGNDGKGLDITVEQTVRSRIENLAAILTGGLSTVLQVGPISCLEGVAAELINMESLGELAADTTFAFFRDTLNPGVFRSANEFDNAVSRCVPNLHPDERKLKTLALVASKFLTGIARVLAVNEPATLAGKISFTAATWGVKQKVAVCMGSAVFTRNPTIQDCVASFSFENPTPILIPNARFSPVITPRTAGGKSTGLPTGITHVSSDAAQAVVTVLTPQNGERQTGELVTNGVGTATITVRDPFTNVSEPYTVTVVRPIITPGVVRLEVGQLMTVALTDASARPVIADGSGLTWTLENERRETSSATPVAVFGPFSGSAGNTISARAPGKVTIVVRNPVLIDPITAEVEVSGCDFSGTYTRSFDLGDHSRETYTIVGNTITGSRQRWLTVPSDGISMQISGTVQIPTGSCDATVSGQTTYSFPAGGASGQLPFTGNINLITDLGARFSWQASPTSPWPYGNIGGLACTYPQCE